VIRLAFFASFASLRETGYSQFSVCGLLRQAPARQIHSSETEQLSSKQGVAGSSPAWRTNSWCSINDFLSRIGETRN
jgi:hypothetical protein